jgi:TrmH family RNA methyltransferase
VSPEVVAVEAGVFDSLAGTEHPQPALAVASPTEADLTDVLAGVVGTGGVVLVLGGLADPGNLGTLIRAAEAAGAAAVVTTAGSADVWSPKVVRSAAGSLFRVPVVADLEPRDLVGALAAAGVVVVALDHRGAVSLDIADLSGPLAVIVGSEAHGVPPDLLEAADRVVSIPMAGRVESLNAGVSGSLVLFERARRFRRGEL